MGWKQIWKHANLLVLINNFYCLGFWECSIYASGQVFSPFGLGRWVLLREVPILLTGNEVHVHPLTIQVWVLLNRSPSLLNQIIEQPSQSRDNPHVDKSFHARPLSFKAGQGPCKISTIIIYHTWLLDLFQLSCSNPTLMISTSTGIGQEHISLSHQGRHISEACLEIIILMEWDLCQLACFTVSYYF